jgi:hypothetical protein
VTKGLFVLSMEFESPDDVVEAVQALDPEAIPHFAGQLRIAIDPVASVVTSWLDEDTEQLEDPADESA